MKGRTVKAQGLLGLVSTVTYRQVNYWCDLGYIRLAVPADGSGSQREFDLRAVLQVRALARWRESNPDGQIPTELVFVAGEASITNLVTRIRFKQGYVTTSIRLGYDNEPELRAWTDEALPTARLSAR